MKNQQVETVQLPEADIAAADARIWDIVRRCCSDENIVESVSRSCYLQGVWDGVQLAMQHPELLAPLTPSNWFVQKPRR